VLAGDAAGFIDPVWSSGVFIATLSGEKTADMLDRVLRQPARRAAEFNRYERQVGRVMDLYLKFVTSWYTQEFAEVFFHPQEFFQLVPAVKRFAMIAPRMSLEPAIDSR
jgi:2-polyprenyl-6-methoxyphenol hydroxylase-like FAD-dependent oxidoreductase